MDTAKGKPDGTPQNRPLASSYDPMEVIQMMRSETVSFKRPRLCYNGRTSTVG